MSVADRAVDLALKLARDNSHGYDQASRWGPDYDCSSFLITVWEQAGVPVKSRGATYTGNMRSVFKACGFKEVNPANGLKAGDVLLNDATHTAMYIGNGQIVHAAGNEFGKATGGKTGDQTGYEIYVRSYYGPWDVVLRYEEPAAAPAPSPAPSPSEGSSAPQQDHYRPGDRYMVQQGDSLWRIAERFLGDGSRWHDLYLYNNLATTDIYPGDVIELPPKDWSWEDYNTPEPEPELPAPEPADETLPVLRRGSTGYAVEVLQMLLMYAGYPLTAYGMDGDLGDETLAALQAFQLANGIPDTGTTSEATWAMLIRG